MNEIEIAAKNFGIFDHVPIGVCVLQKDFVVIFWNNCLEEWTGIHRNKIVGSNILEHFGHLNNPKYLSRLQDIFDGGPPTIFSSQLHRYIIPSPMRDGNLRIQHTTVTPVRAMGGKGFYALLAIQDVTDLTHRIQGYRVIHNQALEEIKERWYAEEELRKAHEELELRVRERTADLVSVNERLQQEIKERKRTEEELKRLISTMNTLVDHMPEGVALFDAEHRIILSNDIGKKYLNILTPGKIEEVLTDILNRPLNDFLTYAPHVVWHEMEIDGHPGYVFELAGRTIAQNNTISGIVLVLKDVTEDRKLKERIHSQEKLAAVGQLAAGIAHDFNNILTGIIGFADMLLADSVLNDVDREMIEAILESGQRAAQLIRQILDFSRKSISEMKPIDLMPFLTEFSRFIRRTIPENIHISIDCRDGKYIALADPVKIQQVLTNLSVNARDAMPEGGELRFTLSHLRLTRADKPPIPDMPEGDWIALSVADTGAGITSEIIPHIFEPFFTAKDVGMGTGLGLSQVYGIVKQHEGFIDVKTEVGKGSLFIICLPAIKAHADATDEKGEAFILKGRDECILIVEDNESVRNFIQSKLSKLGFKVFAAANGKDALRTFENQLNEIKLVITDLIMPEMGGMELSRILKSKNPSIKIIALSGYPIGLGKEDMLQAGIVEYIQKPFQGQTLIQSVCKALEKK